MDSKIMLALVLQNDSHGLLQLLLENLQEDTFDDLVFIMVLALNQHHIRIDRYYEDWLPQYLNSDFFSLFRMTKETFHNLVGCLNLEDKFYMGGQQPMAAEQQLLLTLWWLGKGETLISVSDKFNVVQSTVYNCTNCILDKLIDLKTQYIVWPDATEVVTVENLFRQKSGYPGVIGAIDGCCIKIKAPLDQHDSYIDRSSNHSIKLQGIVTCNKIFTNINVGFPGSAHDSRVLRNSRLFVDIQERGLWQNYFYIGNLHLVGDSAYPLQNWLMTPYKDNGNLNDVQRRHNTKLSKTRVVVEHTFGILKSRWRILRYVNANSIKKIVKIIAACCVLHNFCYLNIDFWDNYIAENYDEEEYMGQGGAIEAVNKRYQIAHSL